MEFIFLLYALIVFSIFNVLTHNFCIKMEMKPAKQETVFRFMNIMILILLLSSYVKVMNVTV
ncbi:hypothetical protein [Lentibacillus saliphilus]|uniref:hypothetical protein n=1 Tax=Lentibacillus saliphilus TaxID=2737028 RepID=UPI001C300CB2|nr:hypothetical protein [Lentibacillus saliphilus]